MTSMFFNGHQYAVAAPQVVNIEKTMLRKKTTENVKKGGKEINTKGKA